MKSHATYDDVAIILHLYELRREEKMRKARAWFASSFKVRNLEDFQTVCPPGSEENANFRMVSSYWEMAASFVTNGVLNEEIFFQSGGELLLVYEKIREFLPHYREVRKNPIAFQNLEKVAKSYIQWMSQRAPDFYSTYQSVVIGRPQTGKK